MVNEPIIVFDNSSRDVILDALDIRKDEQSHLINKEDKLLTNQEYETIKPEEFGGILIGSKIVIKRDKSDLIRYFLNRKE